MTLRLFLDRSVGTQKIAAALRALQLDVETIVDRYGAANSTIRDEQWIAEASRDGRLLISADQRIRYRPLERMAICLHAARCVTFAAGNMTADDMVALFLRHLPQVVSVATGPGPFVYHLTRERLTKMTLDCGASGTPPHHPPVIS
jgi:predicted nuclease of predicted toxin-antitoxin system